MTDIKKAIKEAEERLKKILETQETVLECPFCKNEIIFTSKEKEEKVVRCSKCNHHFRVMRIKNNLFVKEEQ